MTILTPTPIVDSMHCYVQSYKVPLCEILPLSLSSLSLSLSLSLTSSPEVN